ncbi:helix-turn-helix transcriptional regulator [Aquabacter sp. CN5-332]|uniref:helix-turn-helix transcriptional regulator n=1 Tax=Aquabacter sp. CN5-332 TaxID=3156608 RepID=UPI0032B48988
MDGRSRVAWNLRRLRVERKLSQESLAVDAGVDRGYVSGIERRTFNPSIEILDRLAAALAIDISEFFFKPKEGDLPPRPLRSGRKPK